MRRSGCNPMGTRYNLSCLVFANKTPPEVPQAKTIKHAPTIYTNQLHAPAVYTHLPYAPVVYQSNVLPQIYANQPHFPIVYNRPPAPPAPVVYNKLKSQDDPAMPHPGPTPYNVASNVCKNQAGQIVPCAHVVYNNSKSTEDSALPRPGPALRLKKSVEFLTIFRKDLILLSSCVRLK